MVDESATPDLVQRTRANVRGAAGGELDSILLDLATDAVWEVPEHAMRVDGAARIRDFTKAWSAGLEDWRFELDTVEDLGRGVILAAYVQLGRPAGSSSLVEDRGVQVYEWTDGLITAIRLYSDIDDARAAAERLARSRG